MCIKPGAAAIYVATVGTILAVGESAQESSAATSHTCAPSAVDYRPLAGLVPGLQRLPRISTGTARDRLAGFLFYYFAVPWGREQQPGARIFAGGSTPGGGVNMKILWRNRSHLRSRWLLLDGRRLEAIGQGTYDVTGWLSGKILWLLDSAIEGMRSSSAVER